MHKLYFSLAIVLFLFLGCTPQKEDLYEAIKDNNLHKIEKIVQAYPDVVLKTDSEGFLPLDHAIVLHSNIEIIDFLLQQIGPNEENYIFYLPIERALEENYYEAADRIFAAGFNINDEEGNLLNSIIDRETDPNNVKYLLEKGLDVTHDSGAIAEAFHNAVNYGLSDVVTLLLKAGVDPNVLVGGVTPLFEAVRMNKIEVIKSLLEEGADPDALITPLSRPISRVKSVEALELLLEAGTNINLANDGYSPLLIMVSNTAMLTPGDNRHDQMYKVIEKALENHADPNISTKDGQTPLSFALEHSSQEIINLLRSYGARP